MSRCSTVSFPGPAESTSYPASYHNTLIQHPYDTIEPGLPVTYIRNPSRMVAMAEVGAYFEGWTFAGANSIVQQWHKDKKYGLLFVDGHAQRCNVAKSFGGASTDWTFYWNK